MTAIDKAKDDLSASAAAAYALGAGLEHGLWAQLWTKLWTQVQTHMQALGAHPARTVVLLPFFQLQAVARVHSAQAWPSGFTPRFETTTSWNQRIGHFMPGALDISWDAGLDSLRAKDWLQRAGLAEQHSMLTGRLVQTAHQLGALVAAIAPAQRAAWAAQARTQALQGLDKLGSNPLMYEAAVARIALEWAVASRYASDVLFDDSVRHSLDALIVVPGLQANPLALALAQHWVAISSTAQLGDAAKPAVDAARGVTRHAVYLHACTNAHDEADRASACVLRHIERGNLPVALAAVDRVSTRRISATLQLHGVQLLDETGWKLSTTRAAAGIMALLRAARGQVAGGSDEADDALLDWLKHTNAARSQVDALEQVFRAPNSTVVQISTAQAAIKFIVNTYSVNAADDTTNTDIGIADVLGSLRERRRPAQWLHAVQQALRSTGQWDALAADDAGREALQALHLTLPEQLDDHTQAMGLAEFSIWASDCLENASFKPSTHSAAPAQVVVLPLAQVLARPFAAIVIPGADELRLPASPEPQGDWYAAQRAALGLPSRPALAAEQQQVWACAMAVPQVDVLWRSAEGEQTLLPSPLLALWQSSMVQANANYPKSQPAVTQATDPRTLQPVTPTPTRAPLPVAGSLRISSLSASAYSDLRTCPYRYFALRLLGLRDAPELDAQIDKRDFGSWLHSVLSDFHTQRKAQQDAGQTATPSTDAQLLNHCAAQRQMHDAGFVPFAAAWPQVQASYLVWLAQHEAQGWQFDQAELERTRAHGSVQLVGRLDRVDVLSRGPLAGTPYVMDYKTESDSASKAKTRIASEDTQLAFYAALMGNDGTDSTDDNADDELHAAYINLAERSCKTTPQTDVMAARSAVLQGITTDVQRIHAGHTLPALGEGTACDFCAARGLCRKDMWTL